MLESLIIEVANLELKLKKTNVQSERELIQKKIEELNDEIEQLEYEEESRDRVTKFRNIQFY